MHKAFEDQLVQKVMPKLRGIDTHRNSKGGKCLEDIRGLINNTEIGGKPVNLAKDFELASELGYGQFMWQTANYLEYDSTSEKPKAETSNGEGANKTQSDGNKE